MLRALLLATFAFSAHAQTYKWVDANGVVNYSNTPPPVASNATTIPDRISNYAPDPALSRAVDLDRRPAGADTEWLQRQWLMAMQQATPPAPAPDVANMYYPAVAVIAARRQPMVRPTFFLPVPKPRPQRRASVSRL
jgi:Domain of unknown function (DUF4124)